MTDWRLWVKLTGVAWLLFAALLMATQPLTPFVVFEMLCVAVGGMLFLRPPRYTLKPSLFSVLFGVGCLALAYSPELLQSASAYAFWIVALGLPTLVTWVAFVLVLTAEPGLPTSPPAMRWDGGWLYRRASVQRLADEEPGDLLS